MGKVLVTGGAGFIGSHVCEALLSRGEEVRVLDNFDPFYPRSQKEANLDRIEGLGTADCPFSLVEGDIRDPGAVRRAVEGVDGVIHLAALAGVRPSIERPAEYWDVNLVGTQRLLDSLKARPDVRILFGSSSSVYGGNRKVPFHEEDPVNEPISPYAATKRAGELLCRCFHHLHGHPVTCLRFFTVYGPRQRPEMAIHKFTRIIEAGEEVPFFGDGTSSRDYTFISDIIQGVLSALDASRGYRIYNLGSSETTTLTGLVALIGEALGKEPRIRSLPDQPGDAPKTYADVGRARSDLGYEPKVPLKEGIPLFVSWYREARSRGEVP